ncbi:hypothetical protein O0L34_g10131 [Tuta absoluta]|nr:hypothetical protein O0L34_g10131 [Tuta absoluta]
MSTQAYYKERLGFDPQEAVGDVNGGCYDGPHQPKRHRSDKNESHDQVYEENLTKFKGTTCWDFFIQQSGSWWRVIENACGFQKTNVVAVCANIPLPLLIFLH